MVPLLALVAFAPAAGPVFDVSNLTGRVLVVAANGGSSPFAPVKIPATKVVHLTPFRGIQRAKSYSLVLRAQDERVYAKLRFDGAKLLASRRPILVVANPHDAVVRLGSRRFRMIFLPEKK